MSEVQDLLQQAERLPNGPDKVAVVEEAVRVADVARDTDLGFEARDELITAATFSGFPEKALVAFTWCLAQCDQDPERFGEEQLLWKYKWVAAHLPYFPQIPRAKITEVLDDMAMRYERCGQSLQPVFKVRWQIARRMGDRAEALEHHARMSELPRDWGSDCPACEANDRVRYLLYVERRQAALEAARPILSGRLSCAEIPHATLGMVLLPLLRLGRGEEAVRCHQRGYRLIKGDREFVDSASDHLEFLALTHNLDAGAALVEDFLTHALAVTDLDDRFHFLRAVWMLALRLQDAGAARLQARLPAEVPAALPALLAWLEAETGDLAARFDARNGNTAYADELASVRPTLDELDARLPL